jgi:hypothetical protein
MDTFSACLAFGPVAIYLMHLGIVNLSRHPLVLDGTRELLALGLAGSGLLMVGPMRLFLPQEAATLFGPWVWGLMFVGYLLVLVLAILVGARRLIVYSAGLEQSRQILAEVAAKLDPQSQWAGKSLSMPQAGVQLRLENFPPLCNVSLVATGFEQNDRQWRRLAVALRQQMRLTRASGRASGLWLLATGLAILLSLAVRVSHDPQSIGRGLASLLNP